MRVAGTAVGAPEALAERLAAARDVLHPGDGPGAAPAPDLLSDLVGLVTVARENATPASAAWLLLVAVTAAYPPPELVTAVRRAVELKQPEEAAVWLLHAVTPLAIEHGDAVARLRFVTDRPVLDVDMTAKSDFLTGIQRVVRGVATHWHQGGEVALAAWTRRQAGYRALHPDEQARVLQTEVPAFEESHAPATGEDGELLVPWGVPVVLTEVPSPRKSRALAAMAIHTSCSVRAIGYDCIPVASAETVPLAEPEKFGHYLELLKHTDRLAAISASAAEEFRGFVASLPTQGLSGPRVTACSLPTTVPVGGATTHRPQDRPVVVTIGTVGRRKNQVALVEAAELLWREGLDFEVHVLGHVAAERSPLTGLVPELLAAGRPLVLESGVSDARLARALGAARCLVFPSLHEGFGLPVVEALSSGVPVITSDFGSLREVAEDGGALLVDPEDVGELAAALRRLLTDDAEHARLAAQAFARPRRTWAQYADHLREDLLA